MARYKLYKTMIRLKELLFSAFNHAIPLHSALLRTNYVTIPQDKIWAPGRELVVKKEMEGFQVSSAGILVVSVVLFLKYSLCFL